MAYEASLYFWRKIKGTTYVFQPRDKFLFGMLYINLLNLKSFICFWSRIWGFYKFGSFKSWDFAKGLVTELAPLHIQSVWRFRGERIQAVRLAACCNYFSKKKKKSWSFWYLRLSKLILILYLKCFLFGFMQFFVFLIKAMIFGWLIVCLDST